MTRPLRALLFSALSSAALISLVIPSAKAEDFPEGPAKQYVQQICLMCHQAPFLQGQRRTADDWKVTVARMATKGAGGTSDMYDAVAAYMAKNFGKAEDTSKVNMNKGKAEDMVTILGLTPEEAAIIVTYRDKHEAFREWGDLLSIYGVDGRKIEAAKDKMTF